MRVPVKTQAALGGLALAQGGNLIAHHPAALTASANLLQPTQAVSTANYKSNLALVKKAQDHVSNQTSAAAGHHHHGHHHGHQA